MQRVPQIREGNGANQQRVQRESNGTAVAAQTLTPGGTAKPDNDAPGQQWHKGDRHDGRSGWRCHDCDAQSPRQPARASGRRSASTGHASALTAGLACTFTATTVRLHVGAKKRVHAGLITTTLRPEPVDNIGVDAERQQGLPGRFRQPSLYDRPRKHFRCPSRSLVINHDLGVFQCRQAL